ncbi:MAG: glycerophosphodiester phosphodiesterase family protein [Bacillota bacterium]
MNRGILRKKAFWIIAAFVLFVWLNNSSVFVDGSGKRPALLAHRGLAQTFDVEKVQWNTNTARIIHKPEHPYLENTIPSMEAAFRCGADIVEFDVQLTKDKQLAVFHDYALEFRTDGKGKVSDYTMAELRKLDVGYGYTADNGKTYPFRGKSVGMMPSVDDVFEAFPDKEFLVHIKDSGAETGRLLDEHVRKTAPGAMGRISVYGDGEAVRYLKNKYPEMKVLTKPILMKALLLYELVGWTGYTPKAARNLEIHLPLRYARLLWGWPGRFLQRMDRANTRVVLVNGTGGFSSGFDSANDLKKLPRNYSGCIWTNRIDKVAPLVKGE